MPLRLLLILTLLVQQLALPVVASRSAPAQACDQTGCCQVVEATTCCGKNVRVMWCEKSGGNECFCGLAPGDSEPPEAPRPSDRDEITSVFVAVRGGVVDVLRSHVTQAAPAPPAIVRSHHEIRALLGIWRT